TFMAIFFLTLPHKLPVQLVLPDQQTSAIIAPCLKPSTVQLHAAPDKILPILPDCSSALCKCLCISTSLMWQSACIMPGSRQLKMASTLMTFTKKASASRKSVPRNSPKQLSIVLDKNQRNWLQSAMLKHRAQIFAA